MRSKPITADQTKFEYVVTALDNQAAEEVKAALVHRPEQDEYAAIKKAFLSAFGKTQAQKDQELLNSTGLGDCNPIALLPYVTSSLSTMMRRHFVGHFLWHNFPHESEVC